MNDSNNPLCSKEEMLAQLEAMSPADRAFTETMMTTRERFDELVTPIITGLIDGVQPADDPLAVMNDDAMAASEGIKQALTAQLAKLVAVVGVGTQGPDGNNLLKEGVDQTVHALVHLVKMTTDDLAALAAARNKDNG